MIDTLISVVITTYNGSNSIARAIESVRSQSYTNIEIIVVDDNGLGTEEQIRTQSIVQKYDGVLYIPHDRNINGSAARNTGIKAAHGELISLLDDDDEFLTEKIQKQYDAMVKTHATVCYTGFKIIFKNGAQREIIPVAQGNLFDKVLQRKVEAPTSVLMFSKKAAMEINGFDESFQRHQDWEFLDRISENNKIACVSEVCLIRHITDRNIAKSPKKFEEQRLYYLNKMRPYIEKLDKSQRREVYYFHYSDIMRNCVKAKDFKRAVIWFLRAGQPFRLIKDSYKKYKNYRERL